MVKARADKPPTVARVAHALAHKRRWRRLSDERRAEFLDFASAFGAGRLFDAYAFEQAAFALRFAAAMYLGAELTGLWQSGMWDGFRGLPFVLGCLFVVVPLGAREVLVARKRLEAELHARPGGRPSEPPAPRGWYARRFAWGVFALALVVAAVVGARAGYRDLVDGLANDFVRTGAVIHTERAGEMLDLAHGERIAWYARTTGGEGATGFEFWWEESGSAELLRAPDLDVAGLATGLALPIAIRARGAAGRELLSVWVARDGAAALVIHDATTGSRVASQALPELVGRAPQVFATVASPERLHVLVVSSFPGESRVRARRFDVGLTGAEPELLWIARGVVEWRDSWGARLGPWGPCELALLACTPDGRPTGANSVQLPPLADARSPGDATRNLEFYIAPGHASRELDALAVQVPAGADSGERWWWREGARRRYGHSLHVVLGYSDRAAWDYVGLLDPTADERRAIEELNAGPPPDGLLWSFDGRLRALHAERGPGDAIRTVRVRDVVRR